MTDAQRKAHTFLMGQHRQSCFEQGDHPDETDTPYSIGADAIARPMTVAEAAKVLLGDDYQSPMLIKLDGFNNDADVANDVLGCLRALSEGGE